MSIVQRIEIQEYGNERAARAIRATNEALDEQGRAGRRASEGLDRAGDSARESGSRAGGAAGFWETFKKTISGTNEGVGKITQAFQLVGGALGALVGGGVIGGAITAAVQAFGQLRDILTDEEGRLRANAAAVKLLSDAYADFKKSVDKAAQGAREFRNATIQGASDYARGLGIAPDQLSAKGFLSGADEGVAAAAVRRRRTELEGEMLLSRREIAKIKEEFAGDQARIINFSDAWLRRLNAAMQEYDSLRTPLGVGYSEEKKGTPRASSGFFNAARFAEGIYAGSLQGTQFGPTDDITARRLQKIREPERDALGNIVKPFQAAEAAVLAFTQARDKAFDYQSANQFFDVVNTSVEQFGTATAASAANAILFGSSFTKGVNQAMKALAAQAAAQALWEGAQAVGALALGRPDAAALHWDAAGLYTGVAAAAVLGAAASGGLRSNARRSGAAGAGAGATSEVGGDRGGSIVFSPTIIVGLDGETIYRRMHSINDAREGSRSERRFAVAA